MSLNADKDGTVSLDAACRCLLALRLHLANMSSLMTEREMCRDGRRQSAKCQDVSVQVGSISHSLLTRAGPMVGGVTKTIVCRQATDRVTYTTDERRASTSPSLLITVSPSTKTISFSGTYIGCYAEC